MTLASLPDLASRVQSGDMLAFGGKTLHRGPVAFARELARRDVDGLGHVGLAKSMEIDLLCATDQLNRVDFGYVGFEMLGLAPNFRRVAEDGDLAVHEGTCYTVATALRAAKQGVPFLPVSGLDGSDLVDINDAFEHMEDPFNDGESWAVKSVRPDVAVIHATVADADGNVRIHGADLTEGLVARAADTVFVTAERIVESNTFRAEQVDVPGFLVDGVAEVPYGAHPCSCPGEYDYDVAHLETYLGLSRDGRIDEYLDRFLETEEPTYRNRALEGHEHDIEWRPRQDLDSQNRMDSGDGTPPVTVAEAMTVAIARRLKTHNTLFQGFASPLPTVALRLARHQGADITHLSASGAVDGEPVRMPVSTEDQHLLEGATGRFTSPEAFDLAAQGGIDVMFVGGAQVDRSGRMNGSVVGEYDRPTVRFGGAGGSGSLLPLVGDAYAWRTEHSPRVLPEAVDFVTASGNLTYLVTPLCEFERRAGELRVVSLLPGATRSQVAERTGWEVTFDDPTHVAPPTDDELAALAMIDPERVRRSGFDTDQLRRLENQP